MFKFFDYIDSIQLVLWDELRTFLTSAFIDIEACLQINLTLSGMINSYNNELGEILKFFENNYDIKYYF